MTDSIDELKERLRLDLKSALSLPAPDRARVLGYFEDLSGLAIRAQQGEDVDAEMRHVDAQLRVEMGLKAAQVRSLLWSYLNTVVDLGFAALRRVLGAEV
jgi:hypothetical protein